MNKIKWGHLIFLGIFFVSTVLVFTCPDYAEAAETNTIDVKDILGDRLVLEKPAERLVPSFFFEEVFALGAQDKIVGWSRKYWEGRRQWTWEKYVSESDVDIERIPDIGYGATGSANCEKIASMKPDLFLAPFRLPKAEPLLLKYGIPTLHVDFHSQQNTCQSILLMGELLGKSRRAKALVDFYAEQTRKIVSVTQNIPDRKKPRVYIEVGLKPFSTFGSSYMFGKIAQMAGAKSIADGIGVIKTGTISPESLLNANPDIIVITSANWSGNHGYAGPPMGYYATSLDKALAADLLDRPGWSQLKAVKNKRVYFIHHGLSRHIYDFVALHYFAKWFFPERFKSLDPGAAWREYHQLFLPVQFSGIWGASLD